MYYYSTPVARLPLYPTIENTWTQAGECFTTCRCMLSIKLHVILVPPQRNILVVVFLMELCAGLTHSTPYVGISSNLLLLFFTVRETINKQACLKLRSKIRNYWMHRAWFSLVFGYYNLQLCPGLTGLPDFTRFVFNDKDNRLLWCRVTHSFQIISWRQYSIFQHDTSTVELDSTTLTQCRTKGLPFL